MRRSILALPALLTSFALVACGSSGGGTGGGGSGSGGSTTTTTDTTSSTTTDTTSSTTSSTSTYTGPVDQCTDSADLGIIQDPTAMVQEKVGTCGQQNLGMDPATKNCIVMQTGLTEPCAQCFANTVACAAQHCLTQCLSDPASQACSDCRATNCDPEFYLCSGLPQD
jgi:hypothetical protein